jgi:hypothetical protein
MPTFVLQPPQIHWDDKVRQAEVIHRSRLAHTGGLDDAGVVSIGFAVVSVVRPYMGPQRIRCFTNVGPGP